VTTLAKIEANQRNAELSTGPRTVEHGIFVAVPVVPGECPRQWEVHRAGVVESLAPVGLLEVNLAERAALVLWRLQRLPGTRPRRSLVERNEPGQRSR